MRNLRNKYFLIIILGILMVLIIVGGIFCRSSGFGARKSADTEDFSKDANYENRKFPSNEVDFSGMVINDNVVQGLKYKENLVSKYTTLKEQTVYTVGTLHNGHFKRDQNYSLKDLESLLDNLNPDYIFIEAREETLEVYDVIDGPIEMIYAYSYGLEQDIPVRLIDYWKIDNNIITNYSDDSRDNQIFYNINEKLEEIEEEKTIVVLYGASHYFFQKPRIELAGWREEKIDSIKDLFQSDTDEFTYPEDMESVIDKKTDYAQNIIPKIAKENITDQKVLDDFLKDDMKEALENYKKIVSENKLYN